MEDELADSYPSVFDAADEASIKFQKKFFLFQALSLAALVLAAIGGVLTSISVMSATGKFVALVSFLVAVIIELSAQKQQAQIGWYESRAIAESVKSLAWRFSVRAEPFHSVDVDINLEKQFAERIFQIQNAVSTGNVISTPRNKGQITTKMRSIRSSDFDARKNSYAGGRLEVQLNWYRDKAMINHKYASRLDCLVIGSEAIGVIGGIALISGWVDFDFLSVFAAIAAAFVAWLQAKQSKMLAIAYTVTSNELVSVLDDLQNVKSETAWSKFVAQAEEAISREHSLWLSGRGVPTTRFR